MGCCYSHEEEYDPQPRPVYATRRPTPTATTSRSNYDSYYKHRQRPGALYGEYKCSCKYFWVSRLSWRDKYQICKRCKASVRPRNQRELLPSDFKVGSGSEHPQDLCEMCKQLGRHCGKYK